MRRKKLGVPKLHVQKDDTVKVLSGVYRGQQGKVVKVYPKLRKAIVEGVNMRTRHLKPSAKNPEGGIVKDEGLIWVSKLMVIDPKSGEPTRVGRKENDKGKLVRYAKRSGEIIDK